MIKKNQMQQIHPPTIKFTKTEQLHVDPQPEHKLPKINPIQNPPHKEPVITNDTPEFSYSSPMMDEELDIVKNLKNNQIKLDGSVIKHFQNGLKTRGIYYSQHMPMINNDVHTITSPSMVNDVRYNRIDNMLIITDSELSMSFSMSDEGVKSDISVSAKIFPGSIVPIPSDLFFVYDKKDSGTLYIVKNVEPIYDIDETGWNINLSKYYDQDLTPEKLNLQVDNYYIFSFENIGTERNAVIERSEYKILNTLKELFDKLSYEFLSRFYDENKNIIFYKDKIEVPKDELKLYASLKNQAKNVEVKSDGTLILTRYILDPYIMEFFKRNFNKEPLHFKHYAICPENPLWLGDDYMNKYKYTIYSAFVKRNKSILKYPYMVPIFFRQKSLKEIRYDGWHYFEFLDVNSNLSVKAHPDNFPTRIVNNILYKKEIDDVKLLRYNFIFEYFHSDDKKWLPKISELRNIIDNVELIEDNELYGIAPLLLYMCVELQNIIKRKTY